MSRIPMVDPEKAKGKTQELLAAIKARSGRIPNIFKAMAHSPVALMKDKLTWESDSRSWTLPDSVFVWKRRSRP